MTISHNDIKAALSARLDGEKTGLSDDVIDAHLDACDECRAYWDNASALSRSLRYVEPVDDGMTPPPDLSEMIIAGVEPQWRKEAARRQNSLMWARVVIGILAVVHVAWAVLTVGSSPSSDAESMRMAIEAAGLRFAIAVGLAACAWKPRLIPGFAVVPATLTAFLIGFAARDIVLGGSSVAELALPLTETVTVAALGWAFFADRGLYLEQAWKRLSADPV